MKRIIIIFVFVNLVFWGCKSSEERTSDTKLNIAETYDCLQSESGEQVFVNKYFKLFNHNDSLYVLSPDDFKIFVANENFLIKRVINFSNQNYAFNGNIRNFSVGNNGDILLWDISNRIKRLYSKGGEINIITIDDNLKEGYNLKEVQELTDSTILISFNNLMLSQRKDSINIAAIISNSGKVIKIIKYFKKGFNHSFDMIERCLFSIFKKKIAFYFTTSNKIITYDFNGNYLKSFEQEYDRKSYFVPRYRKNSPRKIVEFFAINPVSWQVYNNNLYYLSNRYPRSPRLYVYDYNFNIKNIYDINGKNFYPNEVIKINGRYIFYFSFEPIFYLTSKIQLLPKKHVQ